MESFGGLFVLIVWLCIGVTIAAVSRAGKIKRNGSPKAGNNPVQGGSASGGMSEAAPAGEVRPLQSFLAPSVAYGTHDDSLYQGSLNAETGEGYDPCHEPELQGLNEAETAPAVMPASTEHTLPFGWTGNDMVKGIVMSEILKRRGR